MFFYLSKIFWFFADPGNVLLIALCLGAALVFRRRDKLGRRLLALAALSSFLIAVVPIGENLLIVLENRFPVVQTLPDEVDGIIVLGGVVNEVVSKSRQQISIGGAVERLTEFAALSKKYPYAKLVFTSGSGKLLTQNIKEGDAVGPLLLALGVDMNRVQIENQSRNTYENAVMSKQLVNPAPDETWVLITSAFHMPRTVGIFRQAGWKVLPYPVDFNFQGAPVYTPTFNLLGGFGYLSRAIHEWLGLGFYWLTDKTDSLFPGPE
ncbi:MAG: YdcF family protein, partial [Rhodospirillales bacterium]|nr:YdcF family protein [Rhodospirillales bacterium]